MVGPQTLVFTPSNYNVPQTVTVESPGHPILDGIAPVFDLRDEAYLMPVLEERVRPLLRSNYDFVAENFHHGGVDFKTHPRGSNLVGWTKMARNAPIAYLAHGHGPQVYTDPNYIRLIANAVKWAASDTPHF